MSTTISVAGPKDAPLVVELWGEAGTEPTHTDNVESVRQLLAHDPEVIIVAESDDRIVGSIIAAWDGWRGSIYRLVVAPSHRRHGRGKRLVRAAELRLTGVGAVRVQAIVVGTDLHATAFWRASGWEEQIERLRFVRG